MTAGAATHVPDDSPLAEAAKGAIHRGDAAALAGLLAAHPELATARLGDPDESRSLLHVATDWPGHFLNVAATIGVLVAAGTEVDAPFVGGHTETALHWAASSDDVAALDALLDAGADIEAPGAVLGGGSALADACGFGNWNAARRLVERGAVTRLKDAAALGLMDRVLACLATEQPDEPTVTVALWSACKGGQRQAAALLLERGANLDWVGWDDQTPLDVAVTNGHTDLAAWLRARGARTAAEVNTAQRSRPSA